MSSTNKLSPTPIKKWWVFFVCFYHIWGCSGLCAQGSLLMGGSEGSYGILGIKPGSAACKANTLLLCYHSGPQFSFLIMPQEDPQCPVLPKVTRLMPLQCILCPRSYSRGGRPTGSTPPHYCLAVGLSGILGLNYVGCLK